MGWAVVESGPVYWDSGISGIDADPGEKYQDYRLRLIDYWTFESAFLLSTFMSKVDMVVSEILPVRGFNNMAQALLAGTALTTFQTMAVQNGIAIAQVAAQTVKTRIGGSPK